MKKRIRIEMPQGLVQARTRPFFNRAVGRAFEIKAADGVTEIDLYDEIGFWGVTAKAMREKLKGAGDVRLRINSPGGDVFDGIAMYNDLVAHPGRVTVEIAGLAASAASIVAMAGEEIAIAESAFLMIHNAWGIVVGNRHDMRQVADVLEQIDAALAGVYVGRTGMDRDEVAALLDAETWLSGAAAVDAGFADAITGAADEPQARFDLTGFKNTPPALLADFGEPRTTRDLEAHLREAGWSRSKAAAMSARVLSSLREAGGSPDDDQGEPGTGPELCAALRRFIHSMKD